MPGSDWAPMQRLALVSVATRLIGAARAGVLASADWPIGLYTCPMMDRLYCSALQYANKRQSTTSPTHAPVFSRHRPRSRPSITHVYRLLSFCTDLWSRTFWGLFDLITYWSKKKPVALRIHQVLKIFVRCSYIGIKVKFENHVYCNDVIRIPDMITYKISRTRQHI